LDFLLASDPTKTNGGETLEFLQLFGISWGLSGAKVK